MQERMQLWGGGQKYNWVRDCERFGNNTVIPKPFTAACIIIIFSIDTLMMQNYPSHPCQPIKTCSAVPLLVDVDNWQATVDRVGYKIRSGIIPQYLLHYASVCSTPCHV